MWLRNCCYRLPQFLTELVEIAECDNSLIDHTADDWKRIRSSHGDLHAGTASILTDALA